MLGGALHELKHLLLPVNQRATVIIPTLQLMKLAWRGWHNTWLVVTWPELEPTVGVGTHSAIPPLIQVISQANFSCIVLCTWFVSGSLHASVQNILQQGIYFLHFGMKRSNHWVCAKDCVGKVTFPPTLVSSAFFERQLPYTVSCVFFQVTFGHMGLSLTSGFWGLIPKQSSLSSTLPLNLLCRQFFLYS